MHRALSVAFAIAAAMLSPAPPVQAQPGADFYRGKTLRMLIGYGPGGGYDIYGRLVAEFLPRHLPGNPMMIAQNMPGAGSFVAAKYLQDVAAKDGTVFGSLAQTLALDSLTNPKAKADVAKMPYIGRVVTNIDTGAALSKANIKSFEDVRAKQYNVGASGGGSTTVLFPSVLNAYAGAKFKLIRGYSGTIDILLAMERGEVDIVGAYGLPGISGEPSRLASRSSNDPLPGLLDAASAAAKRAGASGARTVQRRPRGFARRCQHRRDRPLHSHHAGRSPREARNVASRVSIHAQGSGLPRSLRETKPDGRWRAGRGDRRNRP